MQLTLSMKNKDLPILIIGFGSIGKKHYQNLLSLGFTHVSIFDPMPNYFIGFGKVSRVENLILETLQNFRVVFICTPANLHVSQAMMALKANCHVFVEKPLSTSLSSVSKLIVLSKQKKLTVMVACNFQFNNAFKKLSDVLRIKKYGKPVLAQVSLGYYLPKARVNKNFRNSYVVSRKEGGGVFFDSGSHVIAYLTELFGKVKASKALGSATSVLGLKSEEGGGILLEHDSGVVSVIALDYISKRPVHLLQIILEKGKLELDLKNNKLTFKDDFRDSVLYSEEKDENEMFIDEIKHFFKCIETGDDPKQGVREAENVIKILASFKKS